MRKLIPFFLSAVMFTGCNAGNRETEPQASPAPAVTTAATETTETDRPADTTAPEETHSVRTEKTTVSRAADTAQTTKPAATSATAKTAGTRKDTAAAQTDTQPAPVVTESETEPHTNGGNDDGVIELPIIPLN